MNSEEMAYIKGWCISKIFKGSSSYLTEAALKFWQSRAEKLQLKEKEIFDKLMENDKIMDFKDLLMNMSKLSDLIFIGDIIIHKKKEKLFFVFIKFLPAPAKKKKFRNRF